MTIKLKPGCKLAKALDVFESIAAKTGIDFAHGVGDKAEVLEARAPLLEVIRDHIEVGIDEGPEMPMQADDLHPDDWARDRRKKANEIMGVIDD